MLNFDRIMSEDRFLRAITGLSKKKFENLLMDFTREFKKVERKTKKHMTRGIAHTLRSPEEKLVFILFYSKCYPTFDLAGLLYDVNRSQPCRWVRTLLPILEKTLGSKNLLPKRQIHSFLELIYELPELKDIYIDGTERPIQRPKNSQKQKEMYSGKKKRHTVKNLVLNDSKKRIIYLSPTVPGKTHDYTLFKSQGLGDKIPISKRLFMDSAFQGIEKDFPLVNGKMPKKKPRGKDHSATQKRLNKAISRKRVLAENAICGIKRYRCLTDVYRNRRTGMNDQMMSTCSGLWNHYLD